MDTIGPLPTTDEFKYIIVLIDTFTRYVELYPAKDVSAESAAEALAEHCALFWLPNELVTDKGTQFANAMFTELTRRWHIDHITTVAYSKEENAIVERANKEVNRHLRNIMFDTDIHTEWKQYLKLTQRLFNSTVKQALGVSPNNLVLGISHNESDDWFTDYIPETNSDIPKPMQVVLDKIYSRRFRLLETALKHQEQINRDNIRKRYEHYPKKPAYPDRPAPRRLHTDSITLTHITSVPLPTRPHWHYDSTLDTWTRIDGPAMLHSPQIHELDLPTLDITDFSINDYVLRRHPQEVGTSSPLNKYSSWWRGPYIVTDKKWHTKKGKWIYTIRNLVTTRTTDVDVTHIKPFYFDPTYTTPLHIAVRDTDEYVVDHIVDHKLTNDGHLWRVRWADYSETDDTWEPFDTLKDVDAFHVYCKTHQLRQYIPKTFLKRKRRKTNELHAQFAVLTSENNFIDPMN
jgi:transposase InsO family protein